MTLSLDRNTFHGMDPTLIGFWKPPIAVMKRMLNIY
jgi:hypothetical protein